MAFLLLGSPGPAPMAVAATGAIFGYRKGLIFVAGLLVGFGLILGLEIWGVSSLFRRYPDLQAYAFVLGLAYLVYLAWKIGSAPLNPATDVPQNPPGFRDGLVLNLVNPKAYAAVLLLYAQFLLPYENLQTAYYMTALVCFMVVTVIDLLWLLLGEVLSPVFNHPRHGRWVRVLFAALMISMVIWMVISSQ